MIHDYVKILLLPLLLLLLLSLLLSFYCQEQGNAHNETVSRRSVTSVQHSGQLEDSEDDPPV